MLHIYRNDSLINMNFIYYQNLPNLLDSLRIVGNLATKNICQIPNSPQAFDSLSPNLYMGIAFLGNSCKVSARYIFTISTF